MSNDEHKIYDEEQRKIFSERLRYYIAINGKQQNEVAKDISEKPTTLNMWCTGKALPSTGKIQKLADYFGIGKSDLTEKMEDLETETEFISVANKMAMQNDMLNKFIVKYYYLSKDDKKLICDFLERFFN